LADDGVAKIGTLLEHLSSRFDLVVEAVSGFGGRLDSLREEILSQFAEVGQQIRFLCDQIADGQNKLTAVHGDVTAELVRLGEALGAARIEVRQGLAGLGDQVNGNREHLEQSVAEIRNRLAATPAPSGAGLKEVSTASRRELAASVESMSAQIRAELKQTNKTLSALSKKLDRFDDRVTVEVRDHTQRIRKIERGLRG